MSAAFRASTRADVRTSENYETDYWAVHHFGHSQDLALRHDAEGIEWSDGIWRTATFLSWSRLLGCRSARTLVN
jgi:hypothetical protein